VILILSLSANLLQKCDDGNAPLSGVVHQITDNRE
jgi:hypothetical protein